MLLLFYSSWMNEVVYFIMRSKMQIFIKPDIYSNDVVFFFIVVERTRQQSGNPILMLVLRRQKLTLLQSRV